MRVEEIALRQEIRQMLSEAGLNKNTLYAMAQEVLQEEIAKQVKNAVSQRNINSMVYNRVHSSELKDLLREAVRKEVSDAVQLSIAVTATFPENPDAKQELSAAGHGKSGSVS